MNAIAEIIKSLKEGEPFCYIHTKEGFFIGVRMNYDDNLDEYEIYKFDYQPPVKTGTIKLKSLKSEVSLFFSAMLVMLLTLLPFVIQ